jgi:transcriptional regulator with XRE-family HTH domain
VLQIEPTVAVQPTLDFVWQTSEIHHRFPLFTRGCIVTKKACTRYGRLLLVALKGWGHYNAFILVYVLWEWTMDFKDLSSKFKQANKAQDSAPAQPLDFAESYRLRAKMLGVLLRDARLNAERTIADCASLLRVTADQVEGWEYGEDAPSLPQLELLANYLGVPVSHFWGTATLSSDRREQVVDTQAEYLALRDRMIGALLQQARQDEALSLDDLSQATNIPVEQLRQYELGEVSLPMHELTVVAGAVNRNISYFLESSSYIGRVLSALQEWQHFNSLPDDVREFAARPVNIGFIEIAIMLSKMPTDKLREVGTSMLEITM